MLVLFILFALNALPTGVAYQTYNGEIRHLDGVYAVSVSFNAEDGTYNIRDSEEGTDGSLTIVEWETDHQLLLIWEDEHGEGFLRIVFNEDFSEFRGKWWNPEDRHLQGDWIGRRAS